MKSYKYVIHKLGDGRTAHLVGENILTGTIKDVQLLGEEHISKNHETLPLISERTFKIKEDEMYEKVFDFSDDIIKIVWGYKGRLIVSKKCTNTSVDYRPILGRENFFCTLCHKSEISISRVLLDSQIKRNESSIFLVL